MLCGAYFLFHAHEKGYLEPSKFTESTSSSTSRRLEHHQTCERQNCEHQTSCVYSASRCLSGISMQSQAHTCAQNTLKHTLFFSEFHEAYLFLPRGAASRPPFTLLTLSQNNRPLLPGRINRNHELLSILGRFAVKYVCFLHKTSIRIIIFQQPNKAHDD